MIRRLFLFFFLVLITSTVSAQVPPDKFPPVAQPTDTLEDVVAPPIPQEEDAVVNYTPVMPSFEYPGGYHAWMLKNLVYPAEAEEKGIEGKVVLMMVIEKDGSVSNVEIHRSTHPLLDSTALELIRKMPPWKPALYEGKPVRVRQAIPVLFRLDG